MRIMVLTGTAVAFTSMLAVCVATPAAAKIPKNCLGQYQKWQHGECIETTTINPDRVPNQSAQFYRSSHHKKKATAPSTDTK
jgi:hypothetical protein